MGDSRRPALVDRWSPWSSKSYVAAGYRVVAFDRSPSSGDVDLQYRGPLIGIGFVF